MQKFPVFLFLLFFIFGCATVVPSSSHFQFKGFYDKQASGCFDLTNLLPKGFSNKASKDYTKILQSGLDRYRCVVFPDFPVLINHSGLRIRSNTEVYFKPNSLIRLQPTKRPSYAVIRIQNVENVIIYGLKLEGDRERHLAEDGQWGMGVSIRGSRNITLLSPKVSQCWGDGIYIGQKGGKHAKDIVIKDGIIDKNRRNGVTITSGSNIKIINNIISNTSGHMPMSGIDIEPNNNDDILDRILLDGNRTANNAVHGIIISPGNLKGRNDRKISIEIKNHLDAGSKIGLGLALERIAKPIAGRPISGEVYISSSIFQDNLLLPLKNYGRIDNAVKVTLENIDIEKRGIISKLSKSYESNSFKGIIDSNILIRD